MTHTLIIHATQHDPWFNLALEEFLMEQLAQHNQSPGSQDPAAELQAILYLWQNDNTVVIGRNQNAWAECLTGQLEAEGGRLARRSTGGGAVFHDLGNLNFSLILPRSQFNLDHNFDMILEAVASQGIQAERSGRNDILANGLKFSGNAFSLRKAVGLHHGTLLVHSEFSRVARYLTVSPAKLQAKGVSSVQSRITNLQVLNPDITIASLDQAMEQAFIRHYAVSGGAGNDIIRADDTIYRANARLKELHDHYASWEWRYGESLAFDAAVERKFDWGLLQLGFRIDKGMVRQAKAYSDALDCDLIAELPALFTGCRFHSAELADALRQLSDLDEGFGPSRRQMAADIGSLIQEQNW
ncbi:MAG: lipoate--protein ligase [Clostridiaceae bacterium]|nr:lipoate--protein ligase [Clostridiaceae bacterium]